MVHLYGPYRTAGSSLPVVGEVADGLPGGGDGPLPDHFSARTAASASFSTSDPPVQRLVTEPLPLEGPGHAHPAEADYIVVRSGCWPPFFGRRLPSLEQARRRIPQTANRGNCHDRLFDQPQLRPGAVAPPAPASGRLGPFQTMVVRP